MEEISKRKEMMPFTNETREVELERELFSLRRKRTVTRLRARLDAVGGEDVENVNNPDKNGDCRTSWVNPEKSFVALYKKLSLLVSDKEGVQKLKFFGFSCNFCIFKLLSMLALETIYVQITCIKVLFLGSCRRLRFVESSQKLRDHLHVTWAMSAG